VHARSVLGCLEVLFLQHPSVHYSVGTYVTSCHMLVFDYGVAVPGFPVLFAA
jgi:hypothetical protein